MTVVINDVTLALGVIVKFGVAPIAAAGLAPGFQVIAMNVNFLAGLGIGTKRYAGGINSSANRHAGYAAKIAVIIDDLAFTFSVVVQACFMPIAISGLAAGPEIIAMTLDVFAALRVGRTHRATGIAARIDAGCGVATGNALKISIQVRHISSALLVVIQFGFVPVSVCRLAARFQIVTFDANLLAGPRVRTIGNARLVSRLEPGRAGAAAQRTVVIHDIAAAAAIITELGGFHSSIRILAVGCKHITPHINILAALLVGTRWNRLGHAGSPLDGNKR